MLVPLRNYAFIMTIPTKFIKKKGGKEGRNLGERGYETGGYLQHSSTLKRPGICTTSLGHNAK